ncbi:hypothetical protein FRB95_003986 [Tulasnella sp. JGI-2019a]|nr:hypothetical protein FRB95_003986 [Tulasnella sp. JGI-2019a]
MQLQLATLRDGYHNARRPFKERDLQILTVVFFLSIINLAINVPFFTTKFNLAFLLVPWSILHVCLLVYSALYIYVHGRPTYIPGSSETFLMVAWAMLGIPWIRGYFIMNGSALQIRSSLDIAAISFHLLSLICLPLTGYGLYWRYQFDSKYIIEASNPQQEMSTPPSCELQYLRVAKQPEQCPMGSDMLQYIITHVSWWQERCFWKHQYVVVRALVPRLGDSSTRYFRIERRETEWFNLSKANALDHVMYSAVEKELTHDSSIISCFEVANPEEAVQSEYSIEMLGNLINIINVETPPYTLPSVNC